MKQKMYGGEQEFLNLKIYEVQFFLFLRKQEKCPPQTGLANIFQRKKDKFMLSATPNLWCERIRMDHTILMEHQKGSLLKRCDNVPLVQPSLPPLGMVKSRSLF